MDESVYIMSSECIVGICRIEGSAHEVSAWHHGEGACCAIDSMQYMQLVDRPLWEYQLSQPTLTDLSIAGTSRVIVQRGCQIDHAGVVAIQLRRRSVVLIIIKKQIVSQL